MPHDNMKQWPEEPPVLSPELYAIPRLRFMLCYLLYGLAMLSPEGEPLVFAVIPGSMLWIMLPNQPLIIVTSVLIDPQLTWLHYAVVRLPEVAMLG